MLIACILLFINACQTNEPKKLPMMGFPQIVEKNINGTISQDTVPYFIPDFSLIDQDSQEVSQKTIENKVYIADFFFTSCLTICPKVKRQMLRVYEKYKDRPDFQMISHTIDPRHDTIAKLHKYATKLGISAKTWHLVTNKNRSQEEAFDMAQRYIVVAATDSSSADGYTHSGNIMLMDRNKHIRGAYDGTDEKAVSRLIADIELLLKEKE